MANAVEASRGMVTGSALLTVLIARDDGKYMAKCPELDSRI